VAFLYDVELEAALLSDAFFGLRPRKGGKGFRDGFAGDLARASLGNVHGGKLALDLRREQDHCGDSRLGTVPGAFWGRVPFKGNLDDAGFGLHAPV
jgi:hypothetical protein